MRAGGFARWRGRRGILKGGQVPYPDLLDPAAGYRNDSARRFPIVGTVLLVLAVASAGLLFVPLLRFVALFMVLPIGAALLYVWFRNREQTNGALTVIGLAVLAVTLGLGVAMTIAARSEPTRVSPPVELTTGGSPFDHSEPAVPAPNQQPAQQPTQQSTQQPAPNDRSIPQPPESTPGTHTLPENSTDRPDQGTRGRSTDSDRFPRPDNRIPLPPASPDLAPPATSDGDPSNDNNNNDPKNDDNNSNRNNNSNNNNNNNDSHDGQTSNGPADHSGSNGGEDQDRKTGGGDQDRKTGGDSGDRSTNGGSGGEANSTPGDNTDDTTASRPASDYCQLGQFKLNNDNTADVCGDPDGQGHYIWRRHVPPPDSSSHHHH